MEVSGKDVGVQGGVAVAEDLVVDSECIRACMECFSDDRHVGWEDGTGGVVEIGEVTHDGVGHQQRVAGEELWSPRTAQPERMRQMTVGFMFRLASRTGSWISVGWSIRSP